MVTHCLFPQEWKHCVYHWHRPNATGLGHMTRNVCCIQVEKNIYALTEVSFFPFEIPISHSGMFQWYRKEQKDHKHPCIHPNWTNVNRTLGCLPQILVGVQKQRPSACFWSIISLLAFFFDSRTVILSCEQSFPEVRAVCRSLFQSLWDYVTKL